MALYLSEAHGTVLKADSPQDLRSGIATCWPTTSETQRLSLLAVPMHCDDSPRAVCETAEYGYSCLLDGGRTCSSRSGTVVEVEAEAELDFPKAR